MGVSGQICLSWSKQNSPNKLAPSLYCTVRSSLFLTTNTFSINNHQSPRNSRHIFSKPWSKNDYVWSERATRIESKKNLRNIYMYNYKILQVLHLIQNSLTSVSPICDFVELCTLEAKAQPRQRTVCAQYKIELKWIEYHNYHRISQTIEDKMRTRVCQGLPGHWINGLWINENLRAFHGTSSCSIPCLALRFEQLRLLTQTRRETYCAKVGLHCQPMSTT